MELLRTFSKIRKIQLEIQTPTDDNLDNDHPCMLYSTIIKNQIDFNQHFVVKYVYLCFIIRIISS